MLHDHSEFGGAERRDTLRVDRLRLAAAVRVGDLADAWEKLEQRAAWPTQSRLFSATLSALRGDAPDMLLHASRGGVLSGLLPLCRDPGYFTRWRMVGARETHEPGDALYGETADATQLARAIAALRRPLFLDRISAASPLIPALAQAMKGRGTLAVRPAMPCPFISIDEGWRDPESRFNAGRRSDFRRARRRADMLGPVTFETHAPGEEAVDALFDEAVRVEAMGWKQEAGTAIAVDPRQAAIFRSFFRAAAARGLFRLSFMRIGDQAVAMQMAMLWNGRYWLFKIGHDAAFSGCSPGNLLMLHMLAWAAAEGLSGFEFLGVAESWITALWTREQHECVQLRTYPYGLRGSVALASDGAQWLMHRMPRRRS